MPNNHLKRLNNFFERYIDRMLIKDIELLKERNEELQFSYPYILLVCSCIDMFGGIEKDFIGKTGGKSNSTERFKWFVTEWMGKVNGLYKQDNLASLIYDRLRCGLIHQATLKKGFEASSIKYSKDMHLYYISDQKRIFIHSLQFADDFIAAQKMYRNHINSKAMDVTYIDSLYSHYSNMIREDDQKRVQVLNQFTQYLQENKLVFNSNDNFSLTCVSPSYRTIVTSSNSCDREMGTYSPSETISLAVASAAPEEDDLEKGIKGNK